MNPKQIKTKGNPEAIIQTKIENALKIRDWMVKPTHGNAFQSGLPDLYVAHKNHGSRWIEVKNPENYVFTAAQLEWFPKFTSYGIGIWILISDSDEELEKLKKPPNWWSYLPCFASN